MTQGRALVMVRELLPAPHRAVFTIGAAAFVAENAVQAWIWAGLALHPAQLQPDTARLGLDIASFWGPLLTGATTTMIGAVTVLGLRANPLIPRWLTIAAAPRGLLGRVHRRRVGATAEGVRDGVCDWSKRAWDRATTSRGSPTRTLAAT